MVTLQATNTVGTGRVGAMARASGGNRRLGVRGAGGNHVVGHLLAEAHGRLEIDLEGGEVAVVDADELGVEFRFQADEREGATYTAPRRKSQAEA